MLKGLALTPPVIGRISIGRVVEKDGRRLPEKDDGFTVTSQVQGRDGWILHPVDKILRKKPGAKLRSIPIRLLFDDPALNLRANYSLFDRKTGRPLCIGNGDTCRRSTPSGMQTLPCPSPEGCELAKGGMCKPCGRLNVRIAEAGGTGTSAAAGNADELGSFLFRTTGFNSIRTLSARLNYFHAVTGGLLSALPLELRLRGKSTTQSHRAPIYYVDLTVRESLSLAEAVSAARTEAEARKASGFDQTALDEAARRGFAQGAFEESEEEGAAVVEEFFPSESLDRRSDAPGAGKPGEKIDLAGKLAKLTAADDGDGPGDAASARRARGKGLEGANSHGSA